MRHDARDSLRPALWLIGAVLLAKLIYIRWFCPYDLVEDEAHYWLWSRHLDWSYYSKGPGIAWVIGLSTRLFGDAEWAVRLPTVLAQAVSALAGAGLIHDIARRAFINSGRAATPARAALFAAAAALLAPAFQLTGILVTIDGCYLACWALASWAAWRAIMERSQLAWLALGLTLGIGFLFKYTILLLPPGLIVFAWLSSRRTALNLAPHWRRWFTLGLFICSLALIPVLIWNARAGWPTIAHLLGHLGASGGDMPTGGPPRAWHEILVSILTYIAAPLGMFGPALVLALVAVQRVLGVHRLTSGDPPARRVGVHFLVAIAAPIYLFYFVVSFVAEPEQNWAIAAFVTLMPLAGWFAADELVRRRAGASNPSLTAPPAPRTRPIKVLWRLTLIYGLGAAVLLHRGDLTRDALNGLTRLPPVTAAVKSITGREPRPIVTGRLIGSRVMAAHVARALDDLAARTNQSPFVMCEHYGRASQMAYYLARLGRADTPVLSPQSVMGGRRSQFDFWPDTSLARPDLIGRPSLLMSNDKPRTLERWQAMFESVEPLNTPDHKLDGEHKRDRIAYFGHTYRGPKP